MRLALDMRLAFQMLINVIYNKYEVIDTKTVKGCQYLYHFCDCVSLAFL